MTGSGRAFLVRRTLFALFAVWLVLSATFLLVAVAPKTGLGGTLGAAAFGGASESELARLEQQYLESRGLDRPLHVRYADWMVSMVTFQWGQSFHGPEQVNRLIADGLGRTLVYVVPATVLAVLLGVVAGLYGALEPGTRGDRSARFGAYLALGLPNFFVGVVVLHLLAEGPLGVNGPLYGVLADHVLPVLLLATTLVGAMVSYTRAESREYVDTAFVKLVRAKGASERRVAVHVLKNAAPPLFALLFAELLAVLLLGVFVIEAVFGIDGFGSVVLGAVHVRDMPVLLSSTLVIVVVGVGGNLLGDVVTAWLDPRLED
jgi:peptide/nickel transport system permease protein